MLLPENQMAVNCGNEARTFGDCQLPISDFRLVSSQRANWQSAIEIWQRRYPSAIADATDLITLGRP
jgi:hypothetical protein